MDRSMERVGLASLIVVWFIFFKFPLGAVYADQLHDDADALLAFKGDLNDSYYNLVTWDSNFKEDVCSSWSHVACNNGSTSVVRVDLGKTNLSGTLNPGLGNLTNLDELVLYNNSLNGNVTQDLADFLNKVKYVDLTGNKFNTSVPCSQNPCGALPP